MQVGVVSPNQGRERRERRAKQHGRPPGRATPTGTAASTGTPARKPQTHRPPPAPRKSRGGRATADPTTARSGGERGKPRDRDKTGQRAPRTAERQTQGGTAPRRDPTAGRTQRHRNHRNETDTARQSRHNTPPQPANPPRDSPGHQRREPHTPRHAHGDQRQHGHDERRKAEERSVPCAGWRDVRHHAGGSGGVPAAPPGRWRWEGFSEACDDAKQSPRRKTDRRGQR